MAAERSLATIGAPHKVQTLASPKLSEVCGTEEGLPILSRALSTETRATLTSEITSIERALSLPHTSREVDQARAMMAASMANSRADDVEASLEAAAWSLVLGDEEMNGRIPGWAIEAATKEFMAGKHGRFFPKVVEFVSVCREIIARHRWAVVERRRLLDAKVVRQRTPEEIASAADVVARLRDTVPMLQEPMPVKREIIPDDGWEFRRAASVAAMNEMEARRRAREIGEAAE